MRSIPALSISALALPALALPALAAAVVLCATGCVEPNPPGTESGPEEVVFEASIDPDEFLELEPGAGVLIGIEYTSGGRWTVSTVCDTTYSDTPCWFDIVVDSYGTSGIREVDPIDLERDDQVLRLDAFALELDFLTSTELDGVSFSTAPGSTLRVSAALHDPNGGYYTGWQVDPRLMSWVGDGGIHWGAPSDPVDLTPAAP